MTYTTFNITLLAAGIFVYFFADDLISFLEKKQISRKEARNRFLSQKEKEDAIWAVNPRITRFDEPKRNIPYTVLKEGALRIFTTQVPSSEVSLYSYVYKDGFVRRVIHTNDGTRITFFEGKCDVSFLTEKDDFLSIYLKSLTPTSETPKASNEVISANQDVSEDKPKKVIAEYIGKIINFGFTPYIDAEGNDSGNTSFAIDLITEEGTKTLFGKDLERAIQDGSIQKGDHVTVSKFARTSVQNTETGKSVKINPWSVVKN